MAEQTDNYGLTLPDEDDFYNVEDFNGNMDKIDTEIKTAQDKADQAFQSASNGKTLIKNSITGIDPEVTIPTNATFAQLANAISQIQTGVDTEDATVIAEQILAGMTAYVKGVKVTGTMPNNTTDIQVSSAIVSGTGIYLTPPAGYYNGIAAVYKNEPNIKTDNIKAGVNILGVPGKSSVVDTADANVAASQMLEGYSGYANGSKVNGAIVNRSTWYQAALAAVLSDPAGYGAYMQVPAGYYNGGSWVWSAQPDLAAANILPDKSIFGVVGAASIGKKYATGTVTCGSTNVWFANGDGSLSVSMMQIVVAGLTFLPSLILCICSLGTQFAMTICRTSGFSTTYPGWNVVVTTPRRTGGSSYQQYGVSLDNANAYVNSTGFALPTDRTNAPFTWIAYE